MPNGTPFPLRSPRVYHAPIFRWFTSMPFLLRWYYVNPVLTRPTLSLCPYHALWLRRCYNVNFEHVQNLTTSLPFLQISLRSCHASTTLIPFLPRSSGSHYALTLFRERSKEIAETWPSVTGVLISD